MDPLLLDGIFLQRMPQCFPNVTKYLTASKIIVEDMWKVGKEEHSCSYYIFILLKKKNKSKQTNKKHLIVKRLEVPARALWFGVPLILLLERRRRKACHRQSCDMGSGQRAHPVRGVELSSVQGV